MRLPASEHTSRPWRVHALAADFELEDVWAPPVAGGRDGLAKLAELAVSLSAGYEYPAAFRALFALRWKVGELFGWDEPGSGIGERVPSLRERLPADLREGPRGPDLHAVPGRDPDDVAPIFVSLYLTEDEWLSEYASETVHSLMHIGWVRDGSGDRYRAQMAILVKPNGWRGRVYMEAIKPFRHVIYPMQLRAFGRHWRAPARPRRVAVTDPIATSRPYDYADAFEVRAPEASHSSPDMWVRAGVEATPRWIKRLAGHSEGLGSAGIVESNSDLVVLEASDALMETVMIGRNIEGERRTLTTILRFRRPRLARPLWALLGILHRQAARRLVAGGLT